MCGRQRVSNDGEKGKTHREIARLSLASSQLLADFVRELVLAAAGDGRFPDGLFLELDRHCEGRFVSSAEASTR